MHETCWGGGVGVPRATAGVSREGLGKHRWLLSRVQVCGPYRMTAGIIDELLVLLCAQTRGLCWCQAADWRAWCGCRARKRADCATAVVSEPPQPNVAVCASVRIVLVALGTCALGAAVAVRAYARIVLVPSGRLAGPVRLPRVQAHGLRLCADDVANLARRLLYAQTRGLCCSHGAPVPPALRLLCAHTRGLCWCQAADWWDWCGCRVRKRVDCA